MFLLNSVTRSAFVVLYFEFLYFTPNFCIFNDDPDINRDVPQIIRSRGFQSETHYVTTNDGYILTIHRIVNNKISVVKKRPIILQHGLQSSGFDFIINSPGLGTQYSSTVHKNITVSNNLGFALSMFGYDVWLTNSRGKIYGKNHTSLNPKSDFYKNIYTVLLIRKYLYKNIIFFIVVKEK